MENKPTNQSAQIQEAKDFQEFIINSRNKFCDAVEKLFTRLHDGGRIELKFMLQNESDDILIAFDQLRQRYEAVLEYSSSQLEAKDKEMDKAKIEIHRLSEKCGLIAKEQATAQSKSVNPPAQEVDVEKLALKKYPISIVPTDRFEDKKEWDENKDLRQAFIAGANAIQSKAGGYSLDINASEIVNGYCTLYQLRNQDLLSDFASYFLSEIKNQSLTSTPLQTKEFSREVLKWVEENTLYGQGGIEIIYSANLKSFIQSLTPLQAKWREVCECGKGNAWTWNAVNGKNICSYCGKDELTTNPSNKGA